MEQSRKRKRSNAKHSSPCRNTADKAVQATRDDLSSVSLKQNDAILHTAAVRLFHNRPFVGTVEFLSLLLPYCGNWKRIMRLRRINSLFFKASQQESAWRCTSIHLGELMYCYNDRGCSLRKKEKCLALLKTVLYRIPHWICGSYKSKCTWQGQVYSNALCEETDLAWSILSCLDGISVVSGIIRTDYSGGVHTAASLVAEQTATDLWYNLILPRIPDSVTTFDVKQWQFSSESFMNLFAAKFINITHLTVAIDSNKPAPKLSLLVQLESITLEIFQHSRRQSIPLIVYQEIGQLKELKRLDCAEDRFCNESKILALTATAASSSSLKLGCSIHLDPQYLATLKNFQSSSAQRRIEHVNRYAVEVNSLQSLIDLHHNTADFLTRIRLFITMDQTEEGFIQCWSLMGKFPLLRYFETIFCKESKSSSVQAPLVIRLHHVRLLNQWQSKFDAELIVRNAHITSEAVLELFTKAPQSTSCIQCNIIVATSASSSSKESENEESDEETENEESENEESDEEHDFLVEDNEKFSLIIENPDYYDYIMENSSWEYAARSLYIEIDTRWLQATQELQNDYEEKLEKWRERCRKWWEQRVGEWEEMALELESDDSDYDSVPSPYQVDYKYCARFIPGPLAPKRTEFSDKVSNLWSNISKLMPKLTDLTVKNDQLSRCEFDQHIDNLKDIASTLDRLSITNVYFTIGELRWMVTNLRYVELNNCSIYDS